MIPGRFRQNSIFWVGLRSYCGKNSQKDEKTNKKILPEPPTTCCMTGCANCVWLDYAEALTEYFKDGGENAKKEIEKNITDNNVKAYLMHELKMRNKT